jgi:hypothetical protein
MGISRGTGVSGDQPDFRPLAEAIKSLEARVQSLENEVITLREASEAHKRAILAEADALNGKH